MERLSEKKKPEKPVAIAPVTTTKTKPTAEVSAPTTPPSESIHFIADTVLARMREKGITKEQLMDVAMKFPAKALKNLIGSNILNELA